MGETPNPWSGLRSESLSGALELQPGVIEGLVNAAIDVRVRVNAVQKELGKVDQLKPFAAVLPSAEALANRFSAKGQDLKNILGDHLKILDDMNDTFLASGKAYKDTDTGGKADFAKLREKYDFHKKLFDDLGKRPDPAGLSVNNDRFNPQDKRQASPDWKEVGTLKESNWGLPQSLASPQGLKFDPMKAKPENPDAYSYEEYQQIIESLKSGMPITVAQAAADWHWLAGRLKEPFDALSNKMIASENGWRSPGKGGGADRARAAIAAYGSGNDNLVASMKAVGDGLEYVSEWLYTTSVELQNDSLVEIKRMENEPDAAYKARAKESYRKAYVADMERIYVPGIEHTAGVVALLPDPIPPTTGTQPTGPGTTGTGSGAGSGSGSGSGAQGLSSAFQSGMSALTSAAQTASQLAASDAAKAAAKTAAQQAAAAAEQASSAASSGLEQAASALTSGLEQASSAAQSALDQASSAAEQSALSSVPGLAGLSSALEDQAKKMTSAAKSGGGSGGGAGGGAGAGLPGSNLQNASSLFPRAAVTATGMEAMASRAGIAGAGSPMGGMPMAPMGGAGAGAGGQQKEHKRADFLDSVEHLEEAIGAAPIVARPVIEQ
ncbi:hypothetical protein ACWF82_14470 [Nocardia sp. NPDC055053]